ncbi:MAG: CDP-diacylglycerol--glycerol-3-phosphate 3-phosphatidyltransferase [Desulfovibrionaceae bacterium]|nr:CDP-diacylglycerol--glycerol-3-phosphate 3-phosphatidyltransferase [Desulfovibrionaceae bacterium]
MFNLPNCLTLMRIFAAPLVVVLLYHEGPLTCFGAALLFAAASITDLLDGHIARRDNLVTNFGKFLDPLADKVLICSVLIMLTCLNWVSAWITIIIVCRELLVTGLRAMAADEGIVIAADKFGKWKTTLQVIAVIPLTIHYPVMGINVHILGELLLYIALALTMLSGVKYIHSYYHKTIIC